MADKASRCDMVFSGVLTCEMIALHHHRHDHHHHHRQLRNEELHNDWFQKRKTAHNE